MKAFYHLWELPWFVFSHIFPLIYIPAKEAPSSERKLATAHVRVFYLEQRAIAIPKVSLAEREEGGKR